MTNVSGGTMRRFIIGAIGLGVAGVCSSASAGAAPAETLAVYFVQPESEQVMQVLADRFEVLRPKGEGYELVVPESKAHELLSLYPSAELLQADLDADVKAMPESLADVPSMEQRLRSFVTRFPNLVKLETYGTSRAGRPEYFLTMANDVNTPDASKPELMITSATHGDEVITVEVTLGLIEKLLMGHGTDPRLTAMLDNHVIRWVPAVCVDGYANRSRYVDGVDPNRDFAYPSLPNKEPVSGCTKDIVQFFHAHPGIKGTMDIHAAASMIMFPWAWTYDRVPQADYSAMDQLTTSMAEINRFAHGSIADTIYVAKGSSADYYYWKTHATAIAIEVSRNFALTGNNDDVVTENTESTWRFIENF